MPYLTPDELPETDDCRSLLIPASTDWLAIVSGALTELTKTYNWEQGGSVTVDEAVARMELMIEQYYAGCEPCTLPGGVKIIRIGEGGLIEELIGDEWLPPEGDYELPPTPERDEPTPEERLCAAAANASNVLMLAYEDVSDSFNDGLATAAAIASLVALLATLLGSTGFGLAIAALIAIALIIFNVFYSVMEYVTADLWTTDFNDKMICVLRECALEEGDVVHFDFQCVIDKLANATSLTLDMEEVRLFGQIYYLLGWLGSQGLDAAGATTAIIDPVCEDCSDDWCFTFDLTEVDADGSPLTVNGCTASYSGGVGWTATKGGGCAPATGESVLAAINITFASTFIRRVVVVGTSDNRTTGTACAVAFPAINRGGTPVVVCQDIDDGFPLGCELFIEAAITGITAEFQNAAANGVTHSSGTAIIKQVTFYGSGECPFGTPNCIE